MTISQAWPITLRGSANGKSPANIVRYIARPLVATVRPTTTQLFSPMEAGALRAPMNERGKPLTAVRSSRQINFSLPAWDAEKGEGAASWFNVECEGRTFTPTMQGRSLGYPGHRDRGPDRGHCECHRRCATTLRRRSAAAPSASTPCALDARLQRADPEMLTRADANIAHFLLARPGTRSTPCLRGADAAAGGGAQRTGCVQLVPPERAAEGGPPGHGNPSPEERRALARAALFDEAFALHFLEDVFAAGHVAGTWGDVAQRMGTHDFYNENGLEVVTWAGRDRSVVLMGDAHMRPQDAELASNAVRISLQQVIDAATGRSRGSSFPMPPPPARRRRCSTSVRAHLSPARGPGGERAVPALVRGGPPAIPPCRGWGPDWVHAPLAQRGGGFVGFAGAIGGRRVNGGFEESQTEDGLVDGLDLAFRAGLGLEGALGEAGDGLVFASGRVHLRRTLDEQVRGKRVWVGTERQPGCGDPRAHGPVGTDPHAVLRDSGRPAVPRRRCTSSTRERYTEIAVAASNGGLWDGRPAGPRALDASSSCSGASLASWHTDCSARINCWRRATVPTASDGSSTSSRSISSCRSSSTVRIGRFLPTRARRCCSSSSRASTFPMTLSSRADRRDARGSTERLLHRAAHALRLEVLLVMRANLPAAALVASLLGGCAAQPLMPYTADTPPLVLVPAAQAGVQDKRARFREIFCAVLEARKDTASRLSALRPRRSRGRRRAGQHRHTSHAGALAPQARRGAGAGIRIRLLRGLARGTRRGDCAPAPTGL